MSRTDAHCPLPVRVARRDVAAEAVHDHRFGGCDLADRSVYVREWLPSARCSWQWRYTGVKVCSCSLCHGGPWRRVDARRARHNDRRSLAARLSAWRGGDDWAFDDDLTPPTAEL